MPLPEEKYSNKSLQPTAFITGISGQDGSLLAELLLGKGYSVAGCDIAGITKNTWPLKDSIQFFDADVTDPASLAAAFREFQPDEVYHMAAFPHVADSFDPAKESEVVKSIVGGTETLFAAVQLFRRQAHKNVRVFNASTVEVFGNQPAPQNELTPFAPDNPYGRAKEQAFHLAERFRKNGLYVATAIMSNHESTRRPESRVTRKTTAAVARIFFGLQDKVHYGEDLHSIRDWGDASEFMHTAWCMLQQDQPDVYVLGTGQGYTVQDLVCYAFALAGLDWRQYACIDRHLFRPREVFGFLADARKAQTVLGWSPVKAMPQIIREMLEHDLRVTAASLGKKPPRIDAIARPVPLKPHTIQDYRVDSVINSHAFKDFLNEKRDQLIAETWSGWAADSMPIDEFEQRYWKLYRQLEAEFAKEKEAVV